jgi:hypothetical protein
MMDRVDLDEVLVGQGVLLLVYADGVVVHGVLWVVGGKLVWPFSRIKGYFLGFSADLRPGNT